MSLRRPPLIDFAQTRPQRWGGLLLAAVGAGLLGLAALQAQEAQQQLTAQREGLRSLQARLPAARRDGASQSPEERRRRAQMEAVALYLAAPWEGLLGAFESRAQGRVIVRKLEPDAATGMVRMVGETQNIKAMMDYVQGLEADKRLQEVVLLKHERVQESATTQPPAPPLPGGALAAPAPARSGPAPIEFTVVATWRAEARAQAPSGSAASDFAPRRTSTTAEARP
jgi:hypothetical protein